MKEHHSAIIAGAITAVAAVAITDAAFNEAFFNRLFWISENILHPLANIIALALFFTIFVGAPAYCLIEALREGNEEEG